MGTRKNLNDQIADDLKEKIINHTFQSGQKLPNEFELMEEYGVCRYTVREAIKKLTAVGLLEVQRGKGTFVRELKPSVYLKNMVDVVLLDDQSIKDIFDTRLAIEQKAVEMAVRNMNDDIISILQGKIGLMKKALEENDLQKYNDCDMSFHLFIVKNSDNKILYEIELALYDMIRQAMAKSLLKSENLQESLQGHLLILEAIKEKNPDKAALLMGEHLNHCRELFIP